MWLECAVMEQVTGLHVSDSEVVAELPESAFDPDQYLLWCAPCILSDQYKQCFISVDVLTCYSTIAGIPLFDCSVEWVDVIDVINCRVFCMILQCHLSTMSGFQQFVVSCFTIQPCHTVFTDMWSDLHDIIRWWCCCIGSHQYCITTSLNGCRKADLLIG